MLDRGSLTVCSSSEFGKGESSSAAKKKPKNRNQSEEEVTLTCAGMQLEVRHTQRHRASELLDFCVVILVSHFFLDIFIFTVVMIKKLSLAS